MTFHRSLLASALLPLTLAGEARSQETARPQVPQIVTSAQGEVRLSPDKATISIGVQTRAATAAAASSQNSQKQRAIIEAIKARGVPAQQITTSNFNVIPETVYDRQCQAAPRTTSYLVSNNVTVELKRIDQVGPVIDAALAAGANQINSLQFGLTNPDSARRVALGLAVAKARGDAEVMARAAGGALGQLLEISAADTYVPGPPRPYAVMDMRAAKAESVPVEPGQETVTATVHVRWQFVGSGR
jgi:uncharacterized protein YggE